MTDQEFKYFITQRIIREKKRISDIIRASLSEIKFQYLDLLEYDDNEVFLEPLLISYFSSERPTVTLDQLLFGYIYGDRKPELISIRTDSDGIAYLPKVGYFITRHPYQTVELHWKGTPYSSSLRMENAALPFDFRPSINAEGTSIELYQVLPPLYRPFLIDNEEQAAAFKINDLSTTNQAKIEESFSILRKYNPDYYQNIATTVKGILNYEKPLPYSFANFGAHGAIFLNSIRQDNLLFFLEDIIHQSGHVIFNTATALSSQELFTIDPETPLGKVSSLDTYHGSVYAAFHGLYTQLNINESFKIFHTENVFSGEVRHELEGRISDDMKRFASAIYAFNNRKLFTDLGWEIFLYFKDKFTELYQSQRELIEKYDTSNQPYLFSYEKFNELNPVH